MTDDYLKSLRAGEVLSAAHGPDDPFAAAIRATRMSMIVTDATQPDNPIIFVNDAFLALTGYARDEVVGRNCRFLQGALTDPDEVERIRLAIAAGRDVATELLNYRKDGTPFWNALFVSPVRNNEGRIIYFFGSQLDITGRKDAELHLRERSHDLQAAIDARTSELQQALDQKTALLHEVDHRVKNNLQLISSLLLMQTRRTPDPSVRSALRGMLERVNAVATVHRRLFQSEDIERFDVAAFIRDLVSDAVGSTGRDDIEVTLDLERIDVPAAKAAPLALLFSELLGNSLRHAFPDGRAGKILISVARENGHFRIEIADDGVGTETEGVRPGFGQTIIKLLCEQLRGDCETTNANPGVRTVIRLPVNGKH